MTDAKKLFHDLIPDAPSNQVMQATGRNDKAAIKVAKDTIEKIQVAYEQLDLEGRHAFLDEARAYIKGKNLAAHLDHPRYDAGVFVYQSAVMAEITDIEVPRNRIQVNTPEVIADREGIKDSPSYKKFEDFKSKLPDHSKVGDSDHPDGLYGPITHGLQYDVHMRELLDRIIRFNTRPPEKLEMGQIKPPPPIILPTTPPPEPKKDEITVPVPEKKEPNFYGSLWMGSNNGTTIQDAGKVQDNPVFERSSVPNTPFISKVDVKNIEVGVQKTVKTDIADLHLKAGVVDNNFQVTDKTPTVNVNKLTNLTGTVPTYVNETGTYSGDAKLGSANFLGLKGTIDAHIPTTDKLPKILVGVNGGIGVTTSQVHNTDFRQSGVDLTGAYNTNPLPDDSKRSNFGISLGGTIGIDQTKTLPGLKVDVNKIHSSTVDASSVNISAFKTFQLSKSTTLDVSAGLGKTGLTIDHPGDGTVQTTIMTGGGPNQPGGGVPVTITNNVSKLNYLHIDPKGFTPQVQATLNVTLFDGKTTKKDSPSK